MTIPDPIIQWNFGSASGNTVTDSAGNTVTIDRPVFVTEQSRTGLRFDPADGAQNVSTNVARRAPPWTVAVWVLRQADTGGASLLSGLETAFKLEQWAANHVIGYTQYSYGEVGVGGDYTLGASAPLGQWVHLALVATATEILLYVNGQPAGREAISPRLSGVLDMAWIGSSNGGYEYARMILGGVEVYDQALDEGQVQQLLGPRVGVTEGSQAVANGGSAAMDAATVGGASTSKTFTVTNKGEGVLSITGVRIDDTTDFTITPNPVVKDLNKGESLTFTVTFSPKTAGQINATVTISSNDPAHPAYTFTLSGTATAGTEKPEPLEPVGQGGVTPPIAGRMYIHVFGDLSGVCTTDGAYLNFWGDILKRSSAISDVVNVGLSAAIKSDGTVWAISGLSDVYAVQLTGLSNVAAMAVKRKRLTSTAPHEDTPFTAYFLCRDGTVLESEPYVGVLTNQMKFTKLPLSGIVAIAGGIGHSAALDKNGSVWVWGSDDGGQLGGYASNVPQQLPGVNDAIGIAVSYSDCVWDPIRPFPAESRRYTAVLRQGGKAVTVWGNMVPLDARYYSPSRQPVTFPAPSGVTFRSIHGGHEAVHAIDSEGGIWRPLITPSLSWMPLTDLPKSIAVYTRGMGIFGLNEAGQVWMKGQYYSYPRHMYVGDKIRLLIYRSG
jgi:hypothetical protein